MIGEIILVGGPHHGRIMQKPKPRIDLSPKEDLPDTVEENTYVATDQYDDEMREIWVWSDEDGPLRDRALAEPDDE